MGLRTNLRQAAYYIPDKNKFCQNILTKGLFKMPREQHNEMEQQYNERKRSPLSVPGIIVGTLIARSLASRIYRAYRFLNNLSGSNVNPK